MPSPQFLRRDWPGTAPGPPKNVTEAKDATDKPAEADKPAEKPQAEVVTEEPKE